MIALERDLVGDRAPEYQTQAIVVERRQIVPDLMDAIAFLGGGPGTKRSREPAEFPSNAVLITGPSKTGDIELQLTTGVHGPGKWHVIVIR